MTSQAKEAFFKLLFPEVLHPYLPTPTQTAAGLSTLGALGLGYSVLAPEPPKKEETLSPREVRVTLPSRSGLEPEEEEEEKEKEKEDGIEKDAWVYDQLALGAMAPFGVYGLWRGYEAYQNRRHAEKMQQGLARLGQLIDYTQPDEEVLDPEVLAELEGMPKRAALEGFVETLAEAEFEKRAWDELGKALSEAYNLVTNTPLVLGGLFGTGALGSYLMTRRHLLPPEALKPRPDTSLPELVMAEAALPRPTRRSSLPYVY